MKVEIWSDIVCPWCFIGKRHFEKALQEFEHRGEVEVVYRSYELDPAAKKNAGMDSYDHIAAKYGVSREESKQMHMNVSSRAAAAGLTYNMDKVIPANSFDAHRLLHFAATKGLQEAAVEMLFTAYFTEGKDISDRSVLAGLGKSIGLAEEETLRMLAEGIHGAEVRADEEEARQHRVAGVPFFLFARKFTLSGAQPADFFLQALEKTWKELHSQ